MLSSEASAEPGRWKTDRAPFQRGIMDALHGGAKQVVVMKSAQVGWTEILLNAIGYFIHQDPAPILCVQPTLEMGHAFSKDRLAPMLRDTNVLTGVVSEAGSKKGDNTLLHKRFPGGHLTISGANSAAGLASRPVRAVLLDEVDRYPSSAGSEGDPVRLAMKRTQTFWNRVVLMGSTPTIEGLSRIESEYSKSDQRRYHVPCPHCGHMSPLLREDFDATDIMRPVWICRECGGTASESDKMGMIRKGEWVATAPYSGIAGFHISEFYSPWSSWSDIFQAYERAKGSSEQLKTWVNTTLGEVWSPENESIDPEGLARRAEIYPAQVPMDAQILTAGVDIQGDRFEVAVWAWAESGESWHIDSSIISADPSVWEEWERLDEWLGAKFEHQTGTLLPISAVMIDSGYLPQNVYRFSAQRYSARIYAGKGYDGENRPPVAVMSKPKVPGKKPPRIFAIGVDSLKATFYSQLMTESPGPNYVHFQSQPKEFFDQLTAERREIKFVRGYKKHIWTKIRKRNEQLDMRVYAMAALYVLNPAWRVDFVAKQERKQSETAVKRASKKRRGRPWKR